MAQMTDRLAVSSSAHRIRETGADERADWRAGLPDALTWSAMFDPRDGSREIEITDDMVIRALSQAESEQTYPFRREAGAPPPVARAVKKADVIVFPGARVSA